MLIRRWSPEQIYQTLPKNYPGQPEMHVVHETIYQAQLRRSPTWNQGPEITGHKTFGNPLKP
jgi:IS30 family transposase